MKDIKMKKRELFPIIHFLLSFILERFILIFDTSMEIVQTIPRNNIISDAGEKIMGYIIAKLFTLAMIFFIWHLIFFLVDNWKEKKNLRFFATLFAIGTVVAIVFWPYWFCYHSVDNLITYSYALRCLPEYWHSAYTSLVYTAEMMVIPSAVFVTIFQWFFAVFDMGYLYNRINDSKVLNGKGKYWVFFMLIMPKIQTLFFDSYRTEIYTLLCIYIVSKTVMDIVDGIEGSNFDLIRDILLCGFIAVWRTEGIVLGILLFGVKLIFVYRYKLLKSILVFSCVMLSFALFSAPQKLGDKKYYGKDYTFINSLPVLQNILASPNSNLSYDGATADLEALEAVTPVEIIRSYGMDGYRRYNYSQGRYDINQSMVSDDVAKAYNKAYLNLVIHNIPIYVRTQIGMVLCAFQIIPKEYMIYYPEGPANDLPAWNLVAWDIGLDDVCATHFYKGWVESKYIVASLYRVSNLELSIANLGRKILVHPIVNVLLVLTNIYIALSEFVKLIKKRENMIGLGLISFILLGQFAAIALVMPAGALVYLHTYFFCSFVVFLVWLAFMTRERKGISSRLLKLIISVIAGIVALAIIVQPVFSGLPSIRMTIESKSDAVFGKEQCIYYYCQDDEEFNEDQIIRATIVGKNTAEFIFVRDFFKSLSGMRIDFKSDAGKITIKDMSVGFGVFARKSINASEFFSYYNIKNTNNIDDIEEMSEGNGISLIAYGSDPYLVIDESVPVYLSSLYSKLLALAVAERFVIVFALYSAVLILYKILKK